MDEDICAAPPRLQTGLGGVGPHQLRPDAGLHGPQQVLHVCHQDQPDDSRGSHQVGELSQQEEPVHLHQHHAGGLGQRGVGSLRH